MRKGNGSETIMIMEMKETQETKLKTKMDAMMTATKGRHMRAKEVMTMLVVKMEMKENEMKSNMDTYI